MTYKNIPKLKSTNRTSSAFEMGKILVLIDSIELREFNRNNLEAEEFIKHFSRKRACVMISNTSNVRICN